MVAYAKREKAQPSRLTPQEYLERERKAETKSEYDGGLVTAMAGAAWEHNLIASKIGRRLGIELEDKPCEVIFSDLRVRVPQRDKYYYPDVVVVCDKPQFEDAELDTLLNPTLIVEVLSDSTEAKDRGEKLLCYQTLESLTAYVLVTPFRPLMEVYRRHEEGWLYSVTQGLESVVSLESIGCELRLADAYKGIEFQELPDEGNDCEPTTAS